MIVQFIVLIILIMNDLLSNLSRIYIQNKVFFFWGYFQSKTERKRELQTLKSLYKKSMK